MKESKRGTGWLWSQCLAKIEIFQCFCFVSGFFSPLSVKLEPEGQKFREKGGRLIIQDLFFINSQTPLKLLIQMLHLLYHAVVIPELQVQTLWLFDFQSAEVCLERQLLLANSLSALHTVHAPT